MSEWKFVATLHNLQIQKSVGNKHIAILPFSDEIVQTYAHKSSSFKKFSGQFKDQFNRPLKPSFIFSRLDAPINLETLINFRNIVAFCAMTHAWHKAIAYGRQLLPLKFSNYFDIYPHNLSKDEKHIVTSSPSILGLNKVDGFSGQSSPELAPYLQSETFLDEAIFEKLNEVWTKTNVHRLGVNKWQNVALFRSIQMAYNASRLPFANQGTVHDYGTSLILWVSAFEILTHPGSRKVSLQIVLDHLGKLEFLHPRLFRKKYRINPKGKDQGANFVQKYYFQMYQCRNDFQHGNKVTSANLFPYSNRNLNVLTNGALLIYTQLLMHLLQCKPNDYFLASQYEDALLTLYKPDTHPNR